MRKLIRWIKSFLPSKGGGYVIEKTPTQLDVANTGDIRGCNDAGVELVMTFEGLYFNSYKCPAGVWTIGYGTTIYPSGQKVTRGEKITKTLAKFYLANDLKEASMEVEQCLRLRSMELNDNQFAALVSFTYNLGIGPTQSRNRSMGSALANHDLEAMADAFLLYNKARVGGRLKALRGLTRRRHEERKLFLS